jgi:hypothetical protein
MDYGAHRATVQQTDPPTLVLAGLTYGGAWAIITSMGSTSILSLALGYVFASLAFVAAAYRLVGDELREALRRLTFLKPAPPSTSPIS